MTKTYIVTVACEIGGKLFVNTCKRRCPPDSNKTPEQIVAKLAQRALDATDAEASDYVRRNQTAGSAL